MKVYKIELLTSDFLKKVDRYIAIRTSHLTGPMKEMKELEVRQELLNYWNGNTRLIEPNTLHNLMKDEDFQVELKKYYGEVAVPEFTEVILQPMQTSP